MQNLQVKVEKLTQEQINQRNISSWGIWEKEKSVFDWSYSQVEECLILKGKAIIHTPAGDVEIKEGDFVTFPKGLKCKWEIVDDIKKHYNFI